MRPKLWTKDFIVVSSINFLLTLVFYLLVVTIAVFAVDEYQASTSEAGLITGIFIIGTLIGRLFIGRYIETIGRKRTLFIGLLFFTLTTLLYFVHFGVGFLLFNRFIHGLALGVASTATGTIVAQIIPNERKGEGIGYYSMSTALSTAIGPFIGIFMSQHTSFQMIFAFCLSLGVFSFITSFFLYVPAIEQTSKSKKIQSFSISNYIEPKALPIAVITLITAFCYSSVLSFINFYAIEKDLVDAASFFFLVYSIAVLVSRPFTGRLMDTKGANYVMYPAIIFMFVGMFVLSTANHAITLLLAGALIGFGFGNIQSTTQAVAVKLTETHRMGLATSTFFIFLDAGLGFGPYLLGFIIPITGYQYLYIIMGVLSLVSVAFYYMLHGKMERTMVKQNQTTISM